MAMLFYLPKGVFDQRSAPVSDRPLFYLTPRAPHVDILEYYLRLRYRTVETFNNPSAFALMMAKADPGAQAVVNLLPAASAHLTGRTVQALDQWAARAGGSAGDRGAAAPGLVLARPDQVGELTGPFGQAFDGLLAPVPIAQLDRALHLRRAPNRNEAGAGTHFNEQTGPASPSTTAGRT
jgi:hypothetical protein